MKSAVFHGVKDIRIENRERQRPAGHEVVIRVKACGICGTGVDADLHVRPLDIYQKGLTIKGSFINPNTHERAARLIGEGMPEIESLVSHRFALADLGKAPALHSDSQTVKILIRP